MTSLLAVRIVCPFLNNLLGWPAAAVVVPPLRGSAVVLGLFFVVNVLGVSRCFRRFFRRCGPWGRLLVAPVMVPAAAIMTRVVPPVGPPLPGALALRDPGLLPCLLLWSLPRLVPGILWLRIFFHNCQTD